MSLVGLRARPAWRGAHVAALAMFAAVPGAARGDAPPRRQVWTVTPRGLEAVSVKPGISDGAFTAVEADPAAALPVGTKLALGLLNAEPSKSSGPGIKLGNR